MENYLYRVILAYWLKSLFGAVLNYRSRVLLRLYLNHAIVTSKNIKRIPIYHDKDRWLHFEIMSTPNFPAQKIFWLNTLILGYLGSVPARAASSTSPLPRYRDFSAAARVRHLFRARSCQRKAHARHPSRTSRCAQKWNHYFSVEHGY